MNGLIKAAAVLFVGVMGGVCQVSAQTADIGQLRLTGPNFGYQTVGLYNYTGATDGCGQLAAQYNVCNAININTWQLTINFTANAGGLAPSPLVFTSSGAGDVVGPTDASFDAYTGEAGNPWTLAFDLTNANCSPSCDAQISSITFTGTVDSSTLNLYNGSASGPYTLDSLGSQSFSITWTLPATDYTSNPGSLFDSTDIIISNQTVLTPQTITFGPLTTQTLGTAVPALSATANSGLTVAFVSNSTSICTVSGTAVTLAGAGTCSITATQTGNSTYAAAIPVTQTFTVNQTPQTITFGPLSTLALGATPPALSATATSGLDVAFASSSLTVCTVSGTTVTLLTGGTCSIIATQAGNATYSPATPVTQTFTVTADAQTISFGTLTSQVLGSTPPALAATATSGLTVTYVSNNLSVCTVSGVNITLLTTGTCSITASQSGNSTYAAATSVTQTFSVTLTPQTVSFGTLSNLALTSTPPALSATATSGLTVAFASNSLTICTVSGTTVTLLTMGTCSITASQAGNATYSPATPVTQTFTVSLATQTITFGPLTTQTFGTAPPALSATATSGLTVAFASNSLAVCTVSGTTVTLVTGGTCSITASQAGNSTYGAATPVLQTFTVNPASQTITFAPPATQTLGTAPPALSATATSSQAVTFASNSPAVCTVSGVNLTLVSAGTCSITASQAGNASYAAATAVTQTFTVNLTPQTITFGPISTQTIGVTTPPALNATASSALTVTYTDNSLSVCTISGTAITLLTTGTCSITASQAGNTTYAAATSVTQTFLVSTLTAQTITFVPPATQTLGTTPPALSATATSGLAVTFASNSPAVCTVSGVNLTLVSAGTCSITASQPGNGTYATATPITQTFIVAGIPQTIAFGPIGTQTLGTAPPALSATATSTLAVTFTSNSPTVCTVSGTAITFLTGGTCSISANQAGNATYAAATAVTQTFTVNLTPQTITFGPISTIMLSSTPPALSATATSALAVTFASNSPAVCTVSGTAVTLVTTGTCSITASQAGNATYAAATAVTQTFLVSTLTAQSITFVPPATQNLGTPPPALSATATSTLAVTFTSNSPAVCTVSGVNLTLVSAGTCSITASQPGNGTYATATPITQTFIVAGIPQTIAFGPIGTQTLGTAPPALSATATSTLAVTFTSNSPTVCTVSKTAITLLTGGTCSISANQPGNATYAAAAAVTQTFTVNLTPQTITFGPISTIMLSSTPPALSATATSALAVTFTSNSPAICTVSGTALTLVATGTCSITASQAGNATYVAATPVTQAFLVTTLTAQSITFGTLATQVFGSTPPALSATATSTLAVAFTSNSPAVCTVSGTSITLVAVGTCSITASQSGNGTYAAATPITQTFAVTRASQTISFTAPGDQTLGTAPPALTASATSGLAVTFTSTTTPVCTVSGSTLTLVATGTCSITASQAGNANYSAATPAIQSFNVNPVSTGGGPGGGGGTPTTFTVAPQSLSFTYQQGSATAPATQSLSVFSVPTGGSFTASASSTGNWLSIGTSASSSLTTPDAIPVSVNVSGLAPATYSGSVTISSGTSANISVPVSLTVLPATPAVLSVSPTLENFSFAQGTAPLTGEVSVSNAGGGTLQFTSLATSDQGWLKLNGSGSGSATPGSPASVAFTVIPGSLKPGVYNGVITVSDVNSSARSTVKVVLTITGAAGQIQISNAGLTLTAIAGGSAPQPQTFSISNSGAGSLKWTAQTSTLSGGNWLIATPGSGTLAGGQAGTPVSVSANIAGLAAGRYYGSVNIVAQNAVNSPQSVSVVLNVLPSAPSASVLVSTGGVLLIGTAGSTTPAQQTVGLFNLSSSAVGYSTSVFAPGGGNWLSVNPAVGSASPGSGSVQISANLSGLAAGVQFGGVTFSFANGSTATIQVLVLILPAGTPFSAARAEIAGLRALTTVAACSGGNPGFLIPIFQLPASQSSVQVTAATTVQAEVVDDCGNPVTAAAGGSVQVTFSNGDPGINLNDTGSGIWEGTWTPQNAAAQAVLQLAATENGLTVSPSVSTGSVTVVVQAATAGSAPQPTGIANAASAGQATPQVVSPGSYIAIYGTGLAGNGSPSATSLPLPTTLNGTQLFLGGLPMPLLYAASGQVNALVPQEIAPNATYPLVVVVQGTAQSVPVPLTVTELQPGEYSLDTSGSGPGVVTNALTGALITASNPAHAGEYLAIYATGLGALIGANGQTEPADGAVAPSTVIYQTTATVTATVGGVNAPVSFSGLTPTLSALYQINVQMPSGVTPGNAVPVVITATDPQTGATAQSNSVMIAVQ